MDLLQAFVLILGSTAVAGVARRFGLSSPIVLVVVGLAVSFIPGVPELELDPDLVLVVFLPPLLYSAAFDSSYVGLRANLRPILLLSVGLVLFTTIVVGYVAHLLIPGLPLAAAFVLGAIVAPPDAVAATSIGRRLGLPRRLVTILSGESLVNDATALTAYRVAVAAAVGEGFSLFTGFVDFVLIAAGGLLVGLVIGVLLHQLQLRLRDPLLENTASLLTPFVAYLGAEAVHCSGVLAVVIAGLYLGHHSPSFTYATRLQARAVWQVLEFLLESMIFALIGLQLRVIVDDLAPRGAGELIWYALAILTVVIATRFAWVFPAAYLPRRLSKSLRERDPTPPWTWTFVVAWTGMRGVVSLAAAFAIPLETEDGRPFPERSLLLFLTFAVILGTLLLQGLTLPWVIRRLGVVARDAYVDNLTEADAQHQAARAALERLDTVLADEEAPPPAGVVDQLRDKAEFRQLSAWERLGGGQGPEQGETPSQVYRRLRRAMVGAERETFLRLRDDGRIDDEVLRRVQRDLDLEEALLDRQ
jgi:CPA1 family monovalent cation:H+ antiporter